MNKSWKFFFETHRQIAIGVALGGENQWWGIAFGPFVFGWEK